MDYPDNIPMLLGPYQGKSCVEVIRWDYSVGLSGAKRRLRLNFRLCTGYRLRSVVVAITVRSPLSPMEFRHHLFISYAHIDNVALTEHQQGWITRFHETLSAMLGMRIGRKAQIWRDLKLSGNDIFANEIIQQFPQTELLISVLTPRYVESEWCAREVKEFCKSA